MPAFFGVEAKPGRRTPYVPPPEDMRLHLTGATLGAAPQQGERVVLKMRVSEVKHEVFVCSFRGGASEHCHLDLVLDEYAEFSIEGACSVHLVGYYMPEFVPESEVDSGEEEDEEWGQLEGDSESDYSESEEDSEDAAELEHLKRALEDAGGVILGSDSEEDYGSDSEAPDLVPIEDRPTIEEVFDEDEEEKEAWKVKAKKANASKASACSGEDADGNLRLPQKRGARELGGRQVKAAKRLEGESISNKKELPKKEKGKEKVHDEEGASKGGTAAEEHKRGGEKCKGKEKPQENIRRYPNGFEVIVLTRGAPDGKMAKPGKRVQVRYTGRLKTNGKVFDKTKGGSTFSFRLGVGEVIQGWDVGVRGMRVGDKRRLTVPPEMGYGNQAQGPIPANSILVFDVELVGVK